MAAFTERGTAGFTDLGVYGWSGRDGTVVSATTDLVVEVNSHIPNRSHLQLKEAHLNSVANAETLATGIANAVACAWQAEDAAADDVRAFLTYTAVGTRARSTATLNFLAGGTRSGWIWILHGT